ncbi:MAG: type II toxin-antitoxin system RatA family toxin [Proteobacteria bacterium]|nr:type II toxin-antitoxin system RatA family toxin [Pseudomonadota bacterium]
MPVHREERHLPWSREQMFDLVADVARYPEFLPWCTASRIRKREGDVFWADLVIGFKMFRERFTSRVELARPERLDVSYTEGPFKRMHNTWLFRAEPDGSCTIEFDIDFEFRNVILQKAIGMLFHEAVRRMVGAFEARARGLYGPGVASVTRQER